MRGESFNEKTISFLQAVPEAILADPSILILVMKNGTIIEQGTHKGLLKQKGFNEELYNNQFAGKSENTG